MRSSILQRALCCALFISWKTFSIWLIILSLTFPLIQGWTQTQIGQDIDGQADNVQSGKSVSLSYDGSVVAIGANYCAGEDLVRGCVGVYRNIDGIWHKQGQDLNGGTNLKNFGYSVSISSDGSIIAIGAPGSKGGGLSRGCVQVYKFVGGMWQKEGQDINGEADLDYTGSSVSISSDGNIVAVGARGNAAGGLLRGQVRVYHYIAGMWQKVGQNIDGKSDYDSYGRTISLSADGSVVAIGAESNAGGGIARGQVRIFKLVNGTWMQEGTEINGETDGDMSGHAISLSSDGTTIAVGAGYNAGDGESRGHVRVFKISGSVWAQEGADINGESDFDFSGLSVSLSSDGSVVAINSPNNSGEGSQRGVVRIYKKINGSWTQDNAINGEEDNAPCLALSLSSDGKVVALGAPSNSGGGYQRGHVRIYSLPSSTPGWTSSSGSVGCGSEADYETATGVWTLTGFNCYYTTAYTTDALAFVQRSLCGDGSITAQVTSLNGAGWAGVIMRRSNAGGAKKAQLMTNLSSLHRREFRTATGGQAYPQQFPSNQRFWLRLVRQGSQFSGYVSPNGVNWYFVMAQQIAMSPCIEIGLVVTNNMPNSSVTASFANVSHSGGAIGLMAPATIQPEPAPLEFSVYPNPTSGELNLEWSAYAGRPVRIEVLNAQGQLLKFAEFDEVTTSTGQLDISRYPDGIYMVRITSEGLPDASSRVVLDK